jgi:hypothetical protein
MGSGRGFNRLQQLMLQTVPKECDRQGPGSFRQNNDETEFLINAVSIQGDFCEQNRIDRAHRQTR